MAWYDEHFVKQPRPSIRGPHAYAQSTGKNCKRKVWCKMCLATRTSALHHGSDNTFLEAESTSGTGELWNMSRAEGGPMEYRRCNCLTHLRDCALQAPAVKERARVEHVERDLIPRRVPRATRDAREARPAAVLENDHSSAQHATPAQQDCTSANPLPSNGHPSTSHQQNVPSPYPATYPTLQDPCLQLPAAPSTNGYLTDSMLSSLSSHGHWSPGAMWTSDPFSSSYAAANLDNVPVQAPHELEFHPGQPAIGFEIRAEPQASFQDLAAIFGDTSQSPGWPASIEEHATMLLTSTTFDDGFNEGWSAGFLSTAAELSPGSGSASCSDDPREFQGSLQMLAESERAGPSWN